MIEVWVTAKLTDAQYARLEEEARTRYPRIVEEGHGELTNVPNLLRDLLAEALRPLVGEAQEWGAQWSAGPLGHTTSGLNKDEGRTP